MKIISRNAACKFREKYPALQALGADICVVQECEDPQQSTHADYRDFAANGFWWGWNKNKGLGIFATPHVQLTRNDWDAAGLRCYGRMRVNVSFDLIGVWSNPDRKSKSLRDYVAESKRYLALHADKLNAGSIILGDFNSNEQWAASCGEHAHHSLVQQLAD